MSEARLTRRELLKSGALLASLVVFHQSISCGGGGGTSGETPVFALRGDGFVVAIDPAIDDIVARISTEGRGGTLGSITPKGDFLFVANNATGQRTVSIINTKALTLVKNLETGNRPKHPIVSPDGRLVAVNHSGIDNGAIRIVFISAENLNILRTVELPVANTGHSGDFSMHGTWSPDGRLYAIGNYADNKFYLISGDTFTVLSSVDVPGNPHYFDFRGRELWVTVEFNEPKSTSSRPIVYIYDISNPGNPVLKNTLTVELTPDEVSSDARIEGHHGNFTNDGRYFIVCNRGASPFEGFTVKVYDANTKGLVRSMVSNVKGVGHAYISPDNRYAVITQYGDSKIEVISLSDFTTLAVIDTGQGKHMGHAVFSADGKKLYVSNRVADSVFVIDTQTWTIRKRILTGSSGQAQGQVVKDFYAVFERVRNPYLA